MEPVVESPAVLNHCERGISKMKENSRSGAPVEKRCKNSGLSERLFLPLANSMATKHDEMERSNRPFTI